MLCRGDMVKALITCRSLIEGRQTERVAVSGLVDLLAMCYLFAVVITISLSLRSALLYCPPPLLARLAARPLVSSPRLMKTSFPKEKFLARLACRTVLDFIKAWSRLSVLKNFFLFFCSGVSRGQQKSVEWEKSGLPNILFVSMRKNPKRTDSQFQVLEFFFYFTLTVFSLSCFLTSTSDQKSFLQLFHLNVMLTEFALQVIA